jgi:hypothetical protein
MARLPAPAPAARLAALAALVAASAFAGPAAGDPVPGRGERAVAGLSSTDPARRRAALADLISAARQEPGLAARAVPALKEVLRLRGPEERALAVRALPALAAPESLALWLKVLGQTDEDERVLAAAVDGAADRAGDGMVTRALVQRSGDPKATPAQRGLALEALGALGGPGADVRLFLPRPAADWVEESCRALGLTRRGGAEAVDHLIRLLGHADTCPRIHAWEGLTRLTKKALPPDKAAWETWWNAQGGRLVPVAGGPVAAPNPDDRYAPPPTAFAPRFYGLPLPKHGATSRVVFCLDVSQSMYGPALDRSRKELQATLKQCTTAYRFDVIAFNENVLPWAGRFVPAHPVQKERAIDWFLTLEPTSYTNLYDAVELGFGYGGRGRRAVEAPERIDAVFLLSDGAPNRGRHLQPDPIVKAIGELSDGRVPVHTIGAGEAAFHLLKRIAAATQGTFVDAFE